MHIAAALPLSSLALLLLAQGPLATTAAGWSYIDCGLPTDALQLTSLTLSPDPPAAGKELTITATGRALRRIEDGAYADVTVKLGLIRLLKRQFDVCDEARKANASVACPVEEGASLVVHTALPKEILPAALNVAFRGYTVDDEDMLCLDLFVNFRTKL
ncbi:ML domain-containing protein [Mycena vulgaris]|nr:ML domain-containing protein [Mycena vulgaris]